MFGIFKKSIIKKLEIQYSDISTRAFQAQRNGNIELYSELSYEAEKILKAIDEEKEKGNQKKLTD